MVPVLDCCAPGWPGIAAPERALPTYEHTCRKCGELSELLLRNSSQEPVCSHCGSKDLRRRFSTLVAHASDGAAPCEKKARPTASRICPDERYPYAT